MADINELLSKFKAEQAAVGLGQLNAPAQNDLVSKWKADNAMRLAMSVNTAVKSNPDTNAKAKDLADKTGVSADVVGRNLSEFEAITKAREIQRIAVSNPVLAKQMIDPEFAKLAYDDANQLGKIEHGIKTIKELWTKSIKPVPALSWASYQSGIGGAYQSVGENVIQPLWDALAPQSLKEKYNKNLLAEMGKGMVEEAKAVEKQVQAEQPLEAGSWGEGVRGALTSLSIQAPGMLIGGMAASGYQGAEAVRKASMAALSYMGGLTYGQTYGEMRKRGFSPSESEASGTWDATVEVGTEIVPMGKLWDMLKPAGKQQIAKLGIKLAEYFGPELVGESLATFFQDLNNKFMDQPDLTLEQRIDKMIEYGTSGEALQNWISTLKATTIQTGLLGGAGLAVNRFANGRIKEDELKRKSLSDLMYDAEHSRLATRSPSTFTEHVQKIADLNKVSSIYFQSDRIIEEATKQGMSSDDVINWAVKNGVTSEEVDTAIKTGGNIEISIGKVASGFSTDNLFKALQKDMLIDPDTMTMDTEQKVIVNEAAHFQRLDDLYKQSLDRQIEVEDIDVWEESILSQPGLRGRVTRESLMPLIARANVLSGMTMDPAIDHLNRMLKHSNLRVQKFKDFSKAKERADILNLAGSKKEKYESSKIHTTTQIKEGARDRESKFRIDIDPDWIGSLKGKINDVAMGQPGKRIRLKDEPGTGTGSNWTGYGSTYPYWMTDQGWTAKEVIAALKKAVGHEAMGVRQTTIVEAAIESLLKEEQFHIDMRDREQANIVYQAIPEQSKAELDAVQLEYDEQGRVLAPNGNVSNLDEYDARLTRTPTFKKWFGESKVVDENGDPLVVYHGTTYGDIDQFLPNGGKDWQKSLELLLSAKQKNEPFGYMNFRGGAFFSPDPDIASGYTGENKGVVYPVFIKAENPVFYRDNGKNVSGVDPDKTPDALFILTGDRIDEIAVLDPTQVKSIYNRGTFDPNDPSILYQPAYHGSAYSFEKFMIDHLGSGTGDQSFGWGLYFTTDKDLAEWYKITQANKKQTKGQVYKVDIPEDEDLILWDKPLQEQSKKVQDIILKMVLDMNSHALNMVKDSSMSGRSIYLSVAEVAKEANPDITDEQANEYASRLLSSYGIKGNKIVTDRAGKKANFVIFDDSTISMLDRYYQDQKGTDIKPLAMVDLAGTNIVTLFEGANKSSFLHEMGHIFLKDLKYMASYGYQVKEWETTKEWLDIGSSDIITKEQHEKFAEHFEIYLKSGEAPTFELRQAFRAFKNWLTKIYDIITSKQYGRLKDIVITPEIKDMFDHLLATDKEIKATIEQDALIAALDDRLLIETNFTADQIEEYKQIVDQATNSAKEKRDKHKLIGRADRLKEWEKQAVDDVDNLPLYGFLSGLKKNNISISKQSADAVFGESVPSNPIFKKTGEDINIVVSEKGKAYGYNTAAMFLSDLKSLPARQDWIEKRVAQLEGEYSNSGQEVQSAIRTASLRRQLEIESQHLAVLAKKEKIEQAKKQSEYSARWKEAEAKLSEAISVGKKEEEIRKLKEAAKKARDEKNLAFNSQEVTPATIIKEWAKNVIAGRTVRKISNINKLVIESRKHRQAVIAHVKQARWSQALQENEQARLTEYLIAESYKAANKWATIKIRWKNIAKWTNQKKAIKVGTDFKNQINKLMYQYGISNKSPDPNTGALLSFIDEMFDPEGFEGAGPSIPDWIGIKTGPYYELTWTQIQELTDTLNLLYGKGRDEVEGHKLANGQKVVECVDGIISEQADLPKIGELKSDATIIGALVQKMQKEWREYFAHTGILQFIAYRMDGYKQGLAHNLVMNIRTALVKSNEMWTEYLGKVEPLIMVLSKNKNSILNDIAWPELMKDAGMSWTKERVVAACLNMGNTSNLQRLMDGYGLTLADISAIANKLTQDEWLAIQKIWDTIDSLWPKIAEVHERMYFFRPPKIEAKRIRINTSDGKVIELRGGYYPAAYDKSLDYDVARWSEKENLLASNSTTLQKPYAPKSFAKDRAKGPVGRPILLSFDVVGRHFNDTIKFITLAEVIRDAARVFDNKRLRDQNASTIGKDMHNMILPALKQTIRPERFDRGIFETMRRKMSAFYMAYNFWTGFQNLSGVFHVAGHTGISNYLKGTYFVATSPFEKYKAMFEMSGYMKLRSSNMENDFKKMVKNFKKSEWSNITIKGKVYSIADIEDAGWAFIRFVDSVVSLPGWWGKYNAEMDAHGNIQKAIDAADSDINKALGSGLPIDQTYFQRHQFLSLLANFMSFCATQQEVLAIEREAWRAGKTSFGDYLHANLMFFIMPAIMSTFLKGTIMYGIMGAIGIGDEEKDKNTSEDYLIDLAGYRIFGLPFIRDVYGATIQAIENKTPITAVRMPIMEMYKMVLQVAYQTGKIMDGTESAMSSLMWTLFELTSAWAGVPVSRIVYRWNKGLEDIEDGTGWAGNVLVPQENKK